MWCLWRLHTTCTTVSSPAKDMRQKELKAVHRAALAELYELFACLQHRAFRGEL
jgi:hypothetical protein